MRFMLFNFMSTGHALAFERNLKIIKILILSYIWGIILCNTMAFIVWLKDSVIASSVNKKAKFRYFSN